MRADLGHLPEGVGQIWKSYLYLVQFTESRVFAPRAMDRAVRLQPVVVLLPVLVAGSAFGLIGALLAMPVLAGGWEVFEYFYGRLLDSPETHPEPWPADAAPAPP